MQSQVYSSNFTVCQFTFQDKWLLGSEVSVVNPVIATADQLMFEHAFKN